MESKGDDGEFGYDDYAGYDQYVNYATTTQEEEEEGDAAGRSGGGGTGTSASVAAAADDLEGVERLRARQALAEERLARERAEAAAAAAKRQKELEEQAWQQAGSSTGWSSAPLRASDARDTGKSAIEIEEERMLAAQRRKVEAAERRKGWRKATRNYLC